MNWYRFIKFAKGYTYKLPDNLKERLYDFYMFSVLPKTEDIYLDDALDQIEEEVVGRLKKHLLDVVFFALMAEFRHVFNRNRIEELERNINLTQNSEEQSMSEYLPLLKKYHDVFYGGVFVQESLDPSIKQRMRTFKEDNEKYRKSNKSIRAALKETGFNKVDAVKLAAYLFDMSNANWESGYGGEAWKKIAEGWLKLYYATDTSKTIVYIDHIYDLQHNSDTILNKHVAYGKVNPEIPGVDFTWIRQALDHKAKVESPYELLPYVSPQMKRIAEAILHKHYGADRPMASSHFFAEKGEDIKTKWKKLIEQIPNYFKEMPEMIMNLFSSDEMLNFIKKLTTETSSYFMHMWSNHIPTKMKKFFWESKTPEELKKMFYPDFVRDPSLFNNEHYDQLCGEYSPIRLYTPEEKKDVWMKHIDSAYRGTRVFPNMPSYLVELITKEDGKQLIDNHIRDLWEDEERTKLSSSSLFSWKTFKPEIRDIIATDYREELEKIGNQAIQQDMVDGYQGMIEQMAADLFDHIGTDFFARKILQIVKASGAAYNPYRSWFDIPHIRRLLEKMYELDPNYIEEGMAYFNTVSPVAQPTVASVFRQLIANKKSRELPPEIVDIPVPELPSGYEGIYPPTKLEELEYPEADFLNVFNL